MPSFQHNLTYSQQAPTADLNQRLAQTALEGSTLRLTPLPLALAALWASTYPLKVPSPSITALIVKLESISYLLVRLSVKSAQVELTLLKWQSFVLLALQGHIPLQSHLQAAQSAP